MIDWDLLPDKIWMEDGKIVICSTLKDNTDEIITFIEDNIKIDSNNEEFIDWYAAQIDYEEWQKKLTSTEER